MTEEEILDLIESRGLENILEEHYMTLPFALSILDELGYLDLERYREEE
jgi:hypothetical protein